MIFMMKEFQIKVNDKNLFQIKVKINRQLIIMNRLTVMIFFVKCATNKLRTLTHTHIHTYIHTHTQTHKHTHTHTHPQTHTHTHTHTHTRAHSHAHTHTGTDQSHTAPSGIKVSVPHILGCCSHIITSRLGQLHKISFNNFS